METFSTSLSGGMGAAALGAQVTANNATNLRSEEFQAGRPNQVQVDRVDQVDRPDRPDRVDRRDQVETENNDRTRPNQVQASQEQAPGGLNAQREREVANSVRDERTYTANAAVVNVQRQTAGAVVDMRA